jgi:hypothetical protein
MKSKLINGKDINLCGFGRIVVLFVLLPLAIVLSLLL